MKLKKIIATVCAALLVCVFTVFASAADEYAKGTEPENGAGAVAGAEKVEPFADEALVDIGGDETPLGVAAPATGIDQSGLAMQRAVDVIIFGLGIGIASVITPLC